MQAAAHLQRRDIKILVVACNTASAVALTPLQEALSPLPVIGVVEPGAVAAVNQCPGGPYLVLATEATVALGAYRTAIRTLNPDAVVVELACELLVALAEEGWVEGPVAEGIVSRYLDAPLGAGTRPRSIILGCTHFPLLRPAIRAVAGADMMIVDSARTTALAVSTFLQEHALAASAGEGQTSLLATDGARRFARVGGRFLQQQLAEEHIEIVDL
jgi:glutamate racemase